MKKMAMTLIAVLFAGSVSARTFAVLPNEGGGQIALTNETCVLNGKSFKGLFKIIAYGRNGVTVDGCYYYDRDLKTIMASWKTNKGPADQRTYPIQDFQFLDITDDANRDL